jgi:hypothetical protein
MPDTSVETTAVAGQPPTAANLISSQKAPWIGEKLVLRAAPDRSASLHLIPMWDAAEVHVAVVRPDGEGYRVEWGEGREVDVLEADREDVEQWAVEELTRYAEADS